MAKRRAEYQLDRDGGHLEIEAELSRKADEENTKPSAFMQGGIPGRKIAKLRTNRFSGDQSANISATKPVSGFSFTEAKNVSLPSGLGESANDDKLAKFKAINLNFANKINKSINEDPCCILSTICEKYLEYASQAAKDFSKQTAPISATAGTPNFIIPSSKPVESKPTPFAGFKLNNNKVQNAETDNQTNEKTEPKHNPFGAFKFAKPPSEKASITELPSSGSDSEKETEAAKKTIEIKGPQFTLATKPTVKNPAFAFGETLKKKQAAEVDSDDSDVAEEPKGPSFNFTGTIKDSAFTFAKKNDVEKQEPQVSTAAPVFSFGAKEPKQTANSELIKPTVPTGFAFGKAEEKKETPTVVPAFTFGAKSEAVTNEKPAFNFGATTQAVSNDKPAFNFGLKKDSEKKEEDKPAGNTETVKPQFSFGTNNNNTVAENSKPSFSFGGASSAPSTIINKTGFGNTTSFSFEKKEEDKSSNSTPSESSKPNFTFNLPFNQNKPTLASSATPAITSAGSEQEEDKQDALNLESNEEENENVLYTKKAKLMLFQAEDKQNPFLTKGLGMFKILQSKENKKKVRFLLRSEGMGHVLLNSYILPSVSYEQFPNQPAAVKLPIVNSETKKFETFLLRVKTGDDGKDIVDVINKAKEDMK